MCVMGCLKVKTLRYMEKQTGPKLVYSIEQREALELMEIVEEKCPIAHRDAVDTVR